MNEEQKQYFAVLSERAKEIRAISEPLERRAVEYAKASLEFSKILVTNLHLTNAGGLLATPTIAKFVGVESLPEATRIVVQAAPPAFFLTGLLFAALCTLATYRNYQHHAFQQVITKEMNLSAAKLHFPLLPGEEPYDVSAHQAKMKSLQRSYAIEDKAIGRTYKAGIRRGVLSLI